MSLPARHRLRRSADITATVRGGRRTGTGPVVVHVRRRSAATPAPPDARPAERAAPGGAVRLASVTPRAVGGAVLRNRVRRRGHAALLQVLRERDVAPADVVVRYLPGSTDASVDDVAHALVRALERAGALTRDGRDG
ncbi:ribonuclease P protein component [Aquipuribacter sp. SD81]|uniref:ribonuclease P protein component n=1 Tax=Aquipuribacter sp. SD81 TaxID=3127703 RepID=UPI003018B0C9